MNIWDVIIGLVIISVLLWAVLSIRRRKKTGKGCCGNCAQCAGACRRDGAKKRT
jgi:hypothetical protein